MDGMVGEEPKPTLCPNCRQPYVWQKELAGRAVRCETCGKLFGFPQTPTGGVGLVLGGGRDAPPGQGQRPKTGGVQLFGGLGAGACPSCGAELALETVICVNCGMNVKTGHHLKGVQVPSSAAAAGNGAADAAMLSPPGATLDLSLGDILKTPFRGGLPAMAAVVVGGTFLWLGLMAVAVGVMLALLEVEAEFLGLCSGLFGLGVAAVALGWIAQEYVTIVRRYESGRGPERTRRNKLACLARILPATMIAAGLPALGWLAGGMNGSGAIAGIVVGAVLGALYWPMGVAMAAAYRTIHPVKVIGKLVATAASYIPLLLYMAFLTAVVCFVAGGMSLLLVRPASGDLRRQCAAALIAAVIAGTLGQYGIVSGYAVLGMMLRKDRLMRRRQEGLRRMG